MRVLTTPISKITKEDIQNLVDNSVSESIQLEFKRETYGNSDSDKKEFLKDVSAMANTQGGVIIIGIAEKDGLAESFHSVDTDCDAEMLRLNSVLDSSVEPRIVDVHMVRLQVDEKTNVIVIKIPKSWNPPHRTSYKNSKKFYKRNSVGVYEMGITELRDVFGQSVTANNALEEIRKNVFIKIRNQEAPIAIPIDQKGILCISMIPMQALRGDNSIILDQEELKHNLRPPDGSGWNFRFNVDGFVCFGSRYQSYTQIYRDGTIECVISGICREYGDPPQKNIPGTSVSKYILEATSRYMSVLLKHGVRPPVRITVSMLDVKDYRFATYSNRWGFESDELPILRKQDVLLPSIDIMEFGKNSDYYESLQPIFDALWNADGRDRCDYFDENGKWTGHADLR